MVKRLILVAAILLSVALSTLILFGNFAEAETVEWARITEDDVYLFATESDAQRNFVLEKSYYVEILGETERMYMVAVMQNQTDFPRITGYVYKSQVTLCAVPPVSPYYPTIKLTVTAGSAAIRLSPLSSATAALTATNSQQLSYYGSIISYGKTWYYVQYAGCFGYVDPSLVTPPNVPLHPTPLPSKPAVTPPSTQDTDPEPNETQQNATPASEILLIVFVVVLAVGLTLALFLPGNVKKKNNVFDQDI